MKSRRLIWAVRIAYTALLVGLAAIVLFGRRTARREPVVARAMVAESSIKPDLEIATNTVLADVLASVSDTVKRLEMPLATPLDPGKVKSFQTGPVLAAVPSSLRSILKYEGGYEFGHQDSIVYELRTPDSYKGPSGPRKLPQAHYSPNTCLATFKWALSRLGHRNLAVLDDDPWIWGPLDWSESCPPRWILEWPDRKGATRDGMVATVEVDADTLAIKHYWLSVVHFGREPWPTTLTHSCPSSASRPRARSAPDWPELGVQDMDHAYAVALIQAVVPEARDFCRRIGPPFPAQLTEDDLVLPESKASVQSGRVWLSLRLRSGFTVHYHQGHVCRAEAPDMSDGDHAPEQDGLFRQSQEYRGPVRVGADEAVAMVLDVALRRLGLPEKPLWLDTVPVFQRTVNADSTNGLRRYIMWWKRPETKEDWDKRMRLGLHPDTSVWGEVDAVSGELKEFSVHCTALERPDPEVQVPLRSPATAEASRE
jgi:hypothetical protein